MPLGQRLAGDSSLLLVTNTSRRLEVLRSCIANIFENKISDAKKTFPAVIRALKTTGARLALCEELGAHVVGNQVGILASDWLRYLILTPDWLLQTMLEHAQFDLVVRLMNAALQDDSDIDMHGVAAALLPLSCTFGRKLCPGVIQFVYTLIQVILASDWTRDPILTPDWSMQDHAVWQNLQFWEAAFYNDVQAGIKDLYLAIQPEQNRCVGVVCSS